MNPAIQQLFGEYSTLTGNDVVAAILTLADVLTAKPPEPIIVEPENCQSYSVRETAARLKRSSRDVYTLILTSKLRCFRAGNRIRVPLEEIERFETEAPASTSLVPRS